MKKVIFGLLVVALLALPLFGACAKEAPAPAPAPAPTSAPAPAPAPAPEVIKLKYSSPMQEMEPPVRFGYFFCDYIEEKSGGKVVFERFPGGVLGTLPEHLELVRSGSVDLSNLIVFVYKQDIPLHSYPSMQMGSQAEVDEYQYQLNIGIPEAAAILDNELKANNVKLMNAAHAMGENGMISRIVFNTLADLKGKKVGVSDQMLFLPTLGIDIVNMQIADMYESLSRGVVDALTMALGPMAILKWHEVSKCFMSQNEYGGGQPIFINLDTWNSLTPDLQKLFLEAGQATVKYSEELTAGNTAQTLQIFKDAGLAVGKLNAEDTETLFRLNYESQKTDMLEACKKLGKTAEAEALLKYCDELTWGK